jgi:hypothetical protein
MSSPKREARRGLFYRKWDFKEAEVTYLLDYWKKWFWMQYSDMFYSTEFFSSPWQPKTYIYNRWRRGYDRVYCKLKYYKFSLLLQMQVLEQKDTHNYTNITVAMSFYHCKCEAFGNCASFLLNDSFHLAFWLPHTPV